MRTPLFLIGSCLLGLTASLQGQEVGPSEFKINSITTNGNGCPKETIVTNVAPDRMSFSLTFFDNIAEAGPGIDLTSGLKHCQLTLSLSIPDGWRFAVAGFDYRGYMMLHEGMEAFHTTKYFIQGDNGPGTQVKNSKKGPEDNAFFYQQQVPINEKVWSLCEKERAMNISLTMRVWNTNKEKFPNASGLIGTDTVQGSFQKWKLSWSRCP